MEEKKTSQTEKWRKEDARPTFTVIIYLSQGDYIFPVLVLFAVLSNAAVALVLSKKHMITPTNVVLKYMAIAELLVGLVPLPWTLFFFTLGEKRSEEAARQRDSNSTSLMLVAIVSIFLIVNLPQAIFMGLLCVCETFSIRLPILEGSFPSVFLIASNMIVIATYPINFGIYCFMSSSFRQTFKLLFCPWAFGGSNQLQCDRRIIEAPSAVHSSRRSDICSHLVNVCTNSEGFMQVSHHCLHTDYMNSDRQSTQFTTSGRSE
uniref:G_PROTEIN_RECEP_F1_2 domain-containing protein n=2 Tax=Caenorhabditis tropicalis TaxID=1561998 RepID=A0A1I7TMZ1_9PELO